MVEPEPLGTAGAIKFAAGHIDERFVVCNGDILTSLDLRAMVAFHDERGAEATISLSEVDDPSAFGVVPTHADGGVIAFVEKPPRDRAPTRWINAGTYVLEPGFLDRIPPRLNVSIERETFPRMLERPGQLFGYQSDAYWLDIGTPQKYLQAQADVLAGALGDAGSAPVAGAVRSTSGVWVQGDAHVDSGAAVDGPSLLGEGASVSAGAKVEGSVIGAGARVGRDSRVERSVLLAGAEVGDDVTVLDSVIGAGARIERGAVLNDYTIVGAREVVAPGTRLSAAKVG
jgi:NDP-sugar pyrophosphorylase family protein